MYYLVLFIVKVISCLPFRVLYVLSDALYFPVYYLVRYRRKIVRKNLTESFPDKSQAEIIGIEKKFYHFLVDMVMESCKMISISPEEARARMKFVNMDLVNDMLRDGKSVSGFIGHYCNWEWISFIGLWLYEGSVCAQIYHKLNSESMDKLMMTMRERMGNISVEMRKTARFVTNMAADKRPCVIGFISDQSPRRKDIKHYVRFLNHTAPVLIGTERVTKHYGYEAVFVAMRRVKRGYYECEFSLLSDNPKALPDYELSDRYIHQLEEEIKKQPEFYLWSHNRFKYAQTTEHC